MYRKTITCLANSRKPPSSTGSCVAGKVVDENNYGQWIRPVSDRPSHEVSVLERQYVDGSYLELLDIVEICFTHHEPLEHQVENHTFDSNYRWDKRGVMNYVQALELVDTYDDDFWKVSQDTRHGINDKVSRALARDITSSLKLILVSELELRVQNEQGYMGKPGRRRIRGHFRYGNNDYLLSVTDPNIESYYFRQKNGEYILNDVIMCVSLSEIWEDTGDAYRLIASVITNNLSKY